MRASIDDVAGVFAIMPTPATADASDPRALNTVDLDESARAANALVVDGVSAIMTNGTFGEGATLTWDEHREFARVVLDAVAGRVPVFVGATTLNTRDTVARATAFADMGANGLLLGRPMWSPCDDDTTLAYYSAVSELVPELALVVYDNPVAFDGKLSTAVFAGLADIDQVVAVKYPAIGAQYASDVTAARDRFRIMPVDRDWGRAQELVPGAATACWSGSASCGPAAIVALAEAIAAGNRDEATRIGDELGHASETFFPEHSFELFSRYNIQLEKLRIQEAGYIAAGPSRPPYTTCPEDYAEGAREAGRRLARLDAKYRDRELV